MKYLVIAALLSLAFLLIYSRLRPYLEMIRKVSSALKDASATGAASATRPRSGSLKTENKLVQCVACGTWIPADRAIGRGSQTSTYCSRECFEKASTSKERKLAG
ncbi:MAG: hypothetical protein ABI967_01500 [bacterium]